MIGRRVNVREISAAALFLLSPVLYFIFSETSKAAPYQTTARHCLLLINATALRDVQELPGTSLGASQEPAVMGSHVFVRLDPGRTVHLLNAFCGVNGARVTVFIGQGLLGLDRVLGCALVSERPKSNEPSEGTAP